MITVSRSQLIPYLAAKLDFYIDPETDRPHIHGHDVWEGAGVRRLEDRR